MSKLKDKVAVVTGASKGIGASIAKALGAEGASVVVNYASDKRGADRVVAEVAKSGGKAIAVQGDVSKAADVQRIFAETKKAFGHLDVLVNNAAIYQFAPVEQITEEHFDRQFDINVKGLLLATQEAVKIFNGDGGSIINISSVASLGTVPGSSVYSGTKAAVDAITHVLAKELGAKNIRVNAINPGPVETEGFRAAGIPGSDLVKEFEARTPLGRVGQPEDIAPIAVFLASPESGWLTGETLFASGGLR
ncbi:MAG TPA: glucose 1-dehydrogenase [Terriglobales bacterium]|nr:glucose 1-dehydrogenase [Terriglobales bacterium]